MARLAPLAVSLTAAVAAALVAAASTPRGAAAAACSTVNFQGFKVGAATTAGFAGAGVPSWTMKTTKPADRRGDVSAAVDTADPPGTDLDLGDRCRPGAVPPCKPLGMVAVAVEEGIEGFRARCAAACDPSTAGYTPSACRLACQPDDDGWGASFELRWAADVVVQYVRLLDIDASESVTIEAPGGPTLTARGPGNALGVLRVRLGGRRVPGGKMLRVTCTRSCALVDVGYCAPPAVKAVVVPPPVAAPKAATRKPIVLAPVELGVIPRDAVRTSSRSFPVGSGTPFEDLFLLSDVTGSMNSAIRTVRAELPKIVAARSAVSGSVHFGVGSYRDESDPNSGWILDQRVTGNLAAVRAAVAGFKATGGGDSPEANLVALYRLATLPDAAIGWRDGARRVVAWFGDRPGHEPSCIDGDRTRLTRELVAARLREAFITVVAVSLSGGMDRSTTTFGKCGVDAKASGAKSTAPAPTRTGQASYIAKTTGGVVLSLDDSSSDLIVDALAAVDALDVQLTAVTSGCDGVFAVSFDPPLPRTVKPGTVVRIKQTIRVDARVCTALSEPGKPFSCTVDYRASGGSFASQKVASQAITGC